MLDICKYQIGLEPVNSVPVTGRYLAHNGLDRVQKAFLAADLVSGDKQVVEYTILQAAYLAKINTTYVHWAIKQAANRAAILARESPLVPPRIKKLQLPVLPMVDDGDIVAFVRKYGIARTLDACCALEAAE